MTGNGLAQGLQMLALIVLARIYAPEDFGLLGEVQAIATIVVVIITLQLHLTIPLSKNRKEADERLFKVHIICWYIFLILFLPSIYFNNSLALILAIILGFINSFTSYWVYKGSFSKLSLYYVVRALIMIGFQILLGVLNTENGLVYGAITGELFSLIYLGSKILTTDIKLNYYNIIKTESIINFIKEKKQFTLYGTLQELISVANFYAPLLLFIQIYGDNIGGQYAMANRLVWAPVILLTSSLSQVYYFQFSQRNKWDVLNKWIWFDLKYMLLILSIPIAYYYLSDIVTVVFGKEWKMAQVMIFYLLLSGIFFLYSLPFRVAFRAMENIKILLIIESIFLSIIICIFYLLSLNELKTVALLALVSFFQSLIITIISKKQYIRIK